MAAVAAVAAAAADDIRWRARNPIWHGADLCEPTNCDIRCQQHLQSGDRQGPWGLVPGLTAVTCKLPQHLLPVAWWPVNLVAVVLCPRGVNSQGYDETSCLLGATVAAFSGGCGWHPPAEPRLTAALLLRLLLLLGLD